MTIVQAILDVMQQSGRPLSAKEAYNLIEERNLYQFKAADPQSVVAAQLRKHCANLDLPKAPAKKYFALVQKGLYQPL